MCGEQRGGQDCPSGEAPWTSDVPAENRDGGGAPVREQHAQRHQVGESLGIGEPGSAGLSGWREACQHQVMKGLECHAWKFRLCMGHSSKWNEWSEATSRGSQAVPGAEGVTTSAHLQRIPDTAAHEVGSSVVGEGESLMEAGERPFINCKCCWEKPH